MNNRLDIEKQVEYVLSKGVASVVDPEGVFKKKLIQKASGEFQGDIIVKFGVDPTRPDIHLGHAVALRGLRGLQDLGCKVVFLVGDFTAQIGDPTGKSKVRPEIAFAEIEKNMHTYLTQVGKVLRTDPAVFSWIRNSDWFFNVTDIAPDTQAKVHIEGVGSAGKSVIELTVGSLAWKAAAFEQTRMQYNMLHNKEIHDVTLRGFFSVLRGITHSRLIARDFFQNRLAAQEELYMHEMLYPILQGVDSHVLAKVYGSCDLEVGGSDQTFNMLMGRDIMKMTGQPPQAVLSFELLPGLDGKEKMSKSLKNDVGVALEPNDMFGKIMSIPDSLIPSYLRLATYTPLEVVEQVVQGLSQGTVHPMNAKLDLAKQIVSMYHGSEKAQVAAEQFSNIFSKGSIPTEVSSVSVQKGSAISDALFLSGMVKSKSEARRLLDAGAVTCFKETSSEEFKITADQVVESEMVVRIGKHRFARLIPNK